MGQHSSDAIDVDFTVEGEGPQDPWWTIWNHTSPEKARAARESLCYEGEHHGLYWYRDWRTCESYQLPTLFEFQRWSLERKIARLKRGPRRTARYLASLCFLIMLITTLPLLAAGLFLTGHFAAIPPVGWIIGGLPLLGFLVALWRYRGPAASVQPLPSYRLWLSDAEQQDRVRAQNTRTLFAVALLAAYAVHRHHEHEQQEFADRIADSLGNRG